MIKPTPFIWIDGDFVPWDRARIHVLSPTLHYGVGIFEGIRAYPQKNGGVAVLRLTDHIARLFRGAEALMLEMPFIPAQVQDACLELLRRCELTSAYLRPVLFLGDGNMGVDVSGPVRLAIAAWEWGAYHGEEKLRTGLRVSIEHEHLMSPADLTAGIKTCGTYVANNLVKRRAMRAGFDEALMLYEVRGNRFVAEATGQNLFIVRRGQENRPLFETPGDNAPILPGFTRDCCIQLAKYQALSVQQRTLDEQDIWYANEVFLCGTASEVVPVAQVDKHSIDNGTPGPHTMRLQELYRSAVTGGLPEFSHWLTPV